MTNGQPPFHLIVFTDNREARQVIGQTRQFFDNLAVTFANGTIRQAINEPEPWGNADIIIADLNGEADPVQAICDLQTIRGASVAVIALGTDNDIRLYRKLLEAGADDYMYTPLHPRLVTKVLRDCIAKRPSHGAVGQTQATGQAPSLSQTAANMVTPTRSVRDDPLA